jgi:hypothetical protein
MLENNDANTLVEADIINDPSCSYWLKEQMLLERDPIDMLNDIDMLTVILTNRISNISQTDSPSK